MLETEIARPVEVPLDDGAIDRSLAELDVKLAAWIDVARKFRVNLAAGAETAELSEQHDDSKPAGQPASQGTAPSADGKGSAEWRTGEENLAPPSGDRPSDEEAGAPDDSGDLSRLRVLFAKRREVLGHESEQVDDATHEAESETENQQEPQPCLGAEADPNETAAADIESPTVEEDENVLLASLDPETRRYIHVLRRVSGERKSVHRLLEEYRATRARQSEPDKRSWWRLSR